LPSVLKMVVLLLKIGSGYSQSIFNSRIEAVFILNVEKMLLYKMGLESKFLNVFFDEIYFTDPNRTQMKFNSDQTHLLILTNRREITILDGLEFSNPGVYCSIKHCVGNVDIIDFLCTGPNQISILTSDSTISLYTYTECKYSLTLTSALPSSVSKFPLPFLLSGSPECFPLLLSGCSVSEPLLYKLYKFSPSTLVFSLESTIELESRGEIVSAVCDDQNIAFLQKYHQNCKEPTAIVTVLSTQKLDGDLLQRCQAHVHAGIREVRIRGEEVWVGGEEGSVLIYEIC